jgi:hypothetical protein
VREVHHAVRDHIRGAEEGILQVEIICIANSASAAAHDEALQDLVGDVKKVIYANKKWNDGTTDLARRTWIVEDVVHESEADEPQGTASVVIGILYRADRTALYTVKAI